jgi:hypothetical protein
MHVTTFDRVVLGIELAVAVVLWLAFLIPYLMRRTWRTSPWGWHMVAVTTVMAGEGVAFLLLLLGFRPPIWVFEVGFGLVDIVAAQRVWLFVRSRRRQAPITDG